MIVPHHRTLFVVGLSLVIGLSVTLVGCNSQPAEPVSSLGQPPVEEVLPKPAGSLTDESIDKTLSVEGEIVKQCPAVGCWFIVKDETGEVFVDLNPAGLRLKQKREGQRAKVTGRVTKKGSQFRLEAQHVQFETKESAKESQE